MSDMAVEIAPHMWRVDNDHGTFVVFWWTDVDEAPDWCESFVWHLQPNGTWRDYGGYGGAAVGEYPTTLVDFVIQEKRL